MNLTPGRYACEVTAPSSGWLAEAGDKNTPFIRIPLVVTSGKFRDEEVVYQAWISDSAFQRTMKNLREVFPDWNGDIVELAKQVDDGPFVGAPCSIVVEEEEYKGKMRAKIAWLNGPDGSDKIMDANRALQLAQRLSGQSEPAAPRSKTAGYGSARPLPQRPPPKPADPAIDDPDDQDIPF